MFKALAVVAAVAAVGVAAFPDDAGAQQVAQAPAPLATAQYNNDPALQCDVVEVKRVSGGALSIRWRLTNTAGSSAGGLTATAPSKPINYSFHWDEIYYIDPAENKKYTIITDPSNNRVAGIFEGEIAAGQQRGSWAKFAAPPPSSTKISFTITGFPPFEDLPISQ